jgi:hypothetical protein
LGRLGRILSNGKATPKAMASIYRAVLQVVLLYGSESWVLTNSMVQKTLQSFHHVLNLAGLLPIQEYIEKRRKSVETYILSRPIYQRCVQTGLSDGKEYQMAWMAIYNTDFLDALVGGDYRNPTTTTTTTRVNGCSTLYLCSAYLIVNQTVLKWQCTFIENNKVAWMNPQMNGRRTSGIKLL